MRREFERAAKGFCEELLHVVVTLQDQEQRLKALKVRDDGAVTEEVRRCVESCIEDVKEEAAWQLYQVRASISSSRGCVKERDWKVWRLEDIPKQERAG